MTMSFVLTLFMFYVFCMAGDVCFIDVNMFYVNCVAGDVCCIDV